MARKKLIAANWKMYKTPDQAREFFRDFLPLVQGHDRDEIVVCPTFLAIDAAVNSAKGSNVAVGAQDVHWEKEGAFTGEINAAMLVAVSVTHVIIGHSERRQYFGETDEQVAQKVRAAHRDGLIPIVCVGETLAQRERGETTALIARQIRTALQEHAQTTFSSLIVAYEPVWAIGTGQTATPAQAQEVHAAIRATLTELSDRATAEMVRILYGGSVKPDNVDGLMAEADIDGALVGGASLQAEAFARIVQFR